MTKKKIVQLPNTDGPWEEIHWSDVTSGKYLGKECKAYVRVPPDPMVEILPGYKVVFDWDVPTERIIRYRDKNNLYYWKRNLSGVYEPEMYPVTGIIEIYDLENRLLWKRDF